MIKDMLSSLRTLFLPHSHNNYKAKVLRNQSLFILVGLYIMGRSIIDISIGLQPGVLGYAAQIDVTKIVELTNSERQKAGASAVQMNAELSAAAQAKVNDMFENNYWAHVSPKGTEPWYFVSEAGYKYQHAGENLARDFSNARDVVSAWMASPTHKKNLLDNRYKDMGLAVKDGNINGVETTIVVQMFGVAPSKTNAGKIAADNITVKEVFAQEEPKIEAKNEPNNEPQSETQIEPKEVVVSGLSPMNLSKVWSMSFVVLLLVALAVDWIFLLRFNLIRISGKTWAHLTFMWFVGIAIFVIRQGIIL